MRSLDAQRPPGYSATRPLMPASKRFRRTFGLQCAILQTAEIALRYFEESGKRRKKGLSDLLEQRARAAGLAIGLKSFQDARKHAAQWYIVETYQLCEAFLKELIREYRDYRHIDPNAWVTSDGKANLPPLQQLLVNLPSQDAEPLASVPEARLLEYYRLIRNWVVHSNEETQRAAGRAFETLKQHHLPHFQKCYSSSKGPNPPENISFDDFMLFSRMMIPFSYLISDACRLTAQDIERHFATVHLDKLNNPTCKANRIRLNAKAFFVWFHGGDRKLQEEFVSHVLEKFQNGDYFK
jgi:hypothetical protein